MGREVATLAENEGMHPGKHKLEFSLPGLASGTYFARIEAGGRSETQKILLLK